jgi:hypothetical protein
MAMVDSDMSVDLALRREDAVSRELAKTLCNAESMAALMQVKR